MKQPKQFTKEKTQDVNNNGRNTNNKIVYSY